MNVLIDIGNSRLKWACEYQGSISTQAALFHQQQDWQAQLLNNWQALPTPEKVAISCVANLNILQVVMALAKQLWSNCEIIIAKSQAEDFGVKNSYLYPEKLGVDRWLCLIAAKYLYPQTAIWIVDCGTAITVDFIDENGLHSGGLIAPGLTLMKKSLLQNTAALDFTAQAYQPGLANFTEAAIFSGTLYAAVGLIKEALKTHTTSAVLLLTGGDAEIISSQLSYSFIIEPDLVLKGLSIFSHS